MNEQVGRDPATLREIEQRVLWLATRIIDHANRRSETDVKVGGHQASSASMVSIMTALWFNHIGGEDKVAVKPHASPVYHAIKYLTGELDRSYLTTLRQQGGLQAYPSRTKDPDVSDFSTGSVGLGAVAPLFSALTRRFTDHHFGEQDPARFIALVGDAELDEGNVWEAIADPATQGLGNFTMVIDLNRQSLDRVIPDIAATRLKHFFADAGWHVAEAKYGHRLAAAFSEADGDAVEAHIDSMPNEAYQALFGLAPTDVRRKFLTSADPAVVRFADRFSDEELKSIITDLGGHDLTLLTDTFRSCDVEVDRPSVVFAYTIKGHGLPMAGDPMNHAALLSPEQIDDFRSTLGLDLDSEWDRFDPDSDAGRVCRSVGGDINNAPLPPRPTLPIPTAARSISTTGSTSTQEAFGRVLASLADIDGVGDRLVTTAPDVSISTNLGGFINKRGVYSHIERDDHGGADRLLKWAPGPTGQHIELGISEMNLFMLLGQLGLSHDHHGQHLLPVGTVYDPFVLRGLDAFIYGLYNDAEVRRRRHSSRCHTRTRGWSTSVHHHRVRWRGTPQPHVLRASLRHRGRLDSLRRARPTRPPRRHERLPPALHPPHRPAAVRRNRRATRARPSANPRARRRLPARRRSAGRSTRRHDRHHGSNGARSARCSRRTRS